MDFYQFFFDPLLSECLDGHHRTITTQVKIINSDDDVNNNNKYYFLSDSRYYRQQ